VGWLTYWRAAGTFFAQDDFVWFLRAQSGPSIPWGVPRCLSSGLYFKLLYDVVGFNPVAFHGFNLALHLATGLILYWLLAGRVGPFLAAAAAGLFLSSPAFFEALHWVSAITDLLCGFFLALTMLTMVGRGGSLAVGTGATEWRPWVALLPYLMALGSKETAVGAAPVFAWVAWREGGRFRALSASLFLALAFVAVIPLMSARAPTDPYAFHLESVLANLPAYLSAAALGGLGVDVTSSADWPAVAWVRVAGTVGLVLWLAALWRRGSAGAWFGAAWFLALIAPVLFIDRFYFYYLYCALPGLVASLAMMVGQRMGSRTTAWIPAAGLALVLAQATAIELRWRATLPQAPLPRDFVLRRSLIARNALADLVNQRERLTPRIIMVSDQPLASSQGGVITNEPREYQPNRYWDDNVRAAIARGDAFKLVAPQVDSVAFVRWVITSDSSHAIVRYGIDGHLRVMDFSTYAAPESLPGGEALAVLLARANTLLQRRLFPAAAKELESAYRLAPDHPDILINLGSTYAQLGDTARAIEVFTYLVKLAPTDLEALFNLGSLEWYTGRSAEARAHWARLDSLAPGSPLARAARTMLGR